MKTIVIVATSLFLFIAHAGAAPVNPPKAPAPAAGLNWNQWTSLFRDYLDLISRFADVSRDSSNSGVAAVIYADDVLRSKGPEQAIAYFEKTLPEVKDPAVQRAIRLRLAEHYRLTNQPNKALEQLHVLMVASPAGPPATSGGAAAK